MFNIIHGDHYNNTPPARLGDQNYRRQRTDIHSVESLNYCKKSTLKNNRQIPMSNTKPKPKPKTSKSLNVNLHLMHTPCECKKKLKEKPFKPLCKCDDQKKENEPIQEDPREEGVTEESITKTEIGELQATVGRSANVKKLDNTPAKAPLNELILYEIKQRSKSVALLFDWKKTHKFGEKGSGFKVKGEIQDFYKIRDRHLANGTLFEDEEFPANIYSLFPTGNADRSFVWKRPGDIVSDPKLFVEGFSRFDVQQGELGDCWLLAAIANLTLYKRLFFQIVPDDQDFDNKYAGVFHFRFWQYGRWLDVVIDDRLPTDGGELVYLHSTEKNEFWSALLEKAYAKLHGSYEALKGGSTCEAMEDFTGGVTEMYELDNPPPELFKILEKAYDRCSLMGCSLEPDPGVFEAQTPEGLIRGHAYSITKVKYVDISTPNVNGKIPLLRLRNPWGNESEWNGAWSDNAPEWRYISQKEKSEMGLTFDDDGEFWMSYKDWEKNFDRLEICNLNPDSLTENELVNKKRWEMSMFEGEWVKGITAGGCRNFLDTFASNPQYRITLTEPDADDEEGKCTLIVALMQKNRRLLKAASGADLLTVGFAIYFLPNPDRVPKPLDQNFFKYNASVARSPSFINLREVSCRFKLPRGNYCIVPSTYERNDQGEFLLRVFSEHTNNMQYDGPSSYYLRDNNIDDNRVDTRRNDSDDDDSSRYKSPYRERQDDRDDNRVDSRRNDSDDDSYRYKTPYRKKQDDNDDIFGGFRFKVAFPNFPQPSFPYQPFLSSFFNFSSPPQSGSSPSQPSRPSYPSNLSQPSHLSYPPQQSPYPSQPTQSPYPSQSPYPTQPSPYPSYPSQPPCSQPQPPCPSNPYPGGYPPQNPYPSQPGYPQSQYQQPHPQNPQPGYPYSGYPQQQQPQPQQPPPQPPRRRGSDELIPITSLFTRLFK